MITGSIKLTIHEEDLPAGIRGCCAAPEGEDRRFMIIINKALPAAEKEAAFLHEMKHIYHEDHAKGGNVSEIEARRHSTDPITAGELQYWHGALNRYFFNGELQPAIVKIAISRELEGSGTLAQFIGETDPELILFHYEPKEGERLDAVTILLHEMVHQLLYQRGVNDIDQQGQHLPEFTAAAQAAGLEADGRTLTAEAAEKIRAMIDNYKKVDEIIIY